MDEVVKLFGIMLAIMLPVAIAGGILAVVGTFTKRLKARRGPAGAQELEDLRARIEELEHGQRQVHELAERVDFVERMLPALRAGTKE